MSVEDKVVENQGNEDFSTLNTQLDTAQNLHEVLMTIENTPVENFPEEVREKIILALEKTMLFSTAHENVKDATLEGAKCISILSKLKPEMATEQEEWFLKLLSDSVTTLEPKDKNDKHALFNSFDQQLRILYETLNILPKNTLPKIHKKIEHIYKSLNENEDYIPEFINSWIKDSENEGYIHEGINVKKAAELKNTGNSTSLSIQDFTNSLYYYNTLLYTAKESNNCRLSIPLL